MIKALMKKQIINFNTKYIGDKTMKNLKTLALISIIALLTTGSLYSQKQDKIIVIGVAPGPYGDLITRGIKPYLEKKGYQVEKYATKKPDIVFKKGKDELRLAFHYKFIRRSELILAYMMINQFPDVQSIVGSNFVRTNNENGKKVGFHDIASGADKTKSTVKGSVYWDYSSGALGQYYAGSLINLNLIQSEEGFFIIQEKGKELALAFKENVGDDASDLFLNIVESGRLNRSQLNKLEKFSISKIPSNSKEWKFYLKIKIKKEIDLFQF